MDKLDAALRELFGFGEFRPGQREVIERVLAGRHTLAVLPTGSGKSLCYQLTAQMLPGVTLVVSPLIALMQDQVDALQARGFKRVTFFSSTLDASEISARYRQIQNGESKLVYVAPERCDSPRFQEFVRSAAIDLLVVDEAHCISQWGHDFRPHYRTMSRRLPELKKATVLALTATATPEVQRDIIATLGVPGMSTIIGDFNRPNLRFEVISTNSNEGKDDHLLEMLTKEEGASIVYASTRREAGEAYELLRHHGLSVCLYHAGLKPAERTQAQRDFLQGRIRTIVATVAFGMGIDKPNIRRVIHYNIPGTPERYYQEAGRAGRDGLPATCTILYCHNDVRIQRFFIEQSYPEPAQVLRLYDYVRQSHPQPVSVEELVESLGSPELGINAALQILYEQGSLGITPEGRYLPAHPEAEKPVVNFGPSQQRRERDESRLKRMIAYAGNRVCRRVPILNYFGQRFTPPCRHCDVCVPNEIKTKESATTATVESDHTARIILQAAEEIRGRWGRIMVRDVLAGSKRKKLMQAGLHMHQAYGRLRPHKPDSIASWMDECIRHGYLQVTAEEYPRLMITSAGRQALDDANLISLSGFQPKKAAAGPVQQKTEPATVEIESESTLARLHDLRFQIELFRQGGPEPDRKNLLEAVTNTGGIFPADVVLAVNALSALNAQEACKPLIELLNSPDSNICANACDALGKLNAVQGTPQLIRQLAHTSPSVRRAAVRALGRLRAKQAQPQLQRLLAEDPSDVVRLSARAALMLLK